MTGDPGGVDPLAQLTQALSSIRALRSRLQAVDSDRREPVAIIGLGCRFPGGANSPAAFWKMLREGADLITEVPAARWDAEALFSPDFQDRGRMNTKRGGFVEAPDLFDRGFFGISPREAARMDPQQRMLLETAYEALEDAGQPLEDWAGAAVGVFVGAHSHSSDYFLMQAGDLGDLGSHTATGTAHSTLANRLSYCFDWRGPSLAVDTACSSSLVALHLAVRSLRERECHLAIAGGVNLVLRPEMSVALSRLGMMSPDGRCKTFDAGADGFVRGEGCGVVALKRLSDALAGDDPILAVIAGSAVNQDGMTNGLTAPNGHSQQLVLRQALKDAGVGPGEVTYVEAHGTGTALGDPIEVEALAEVIGRAGDRTCVLGSVKTNVGHLEAAAGIAGVIKTVLALQHGEIPRSLHFHRLNPHISLEGTRLRIAAERQAWPGADGAAGERVAGVSSFGFGGTNAHVILRSAPSPAIGGAPEAGSDGAVLLPLSARDETALRELAGAWVDFLGSTEEAMGDIVHTAGSRRSHHEHRMAVVAASKAEASRRLRGFLEGGEHGGTVVGRAGAPGASGPVFVFSGQGAQWPGMARDLFEAAPVFRSALEACDEAYRRFAGKGGGSLIGELFADEDSSRLQRTEIAQPAIVALQVALSSVLRSWGVVPEAVVGHSVGEIAAAHVAGVLSLEDAMQVAVLRGRLMQGASGKGRMAAVQLPAQEVLSRLAGGGGEVEVAAMNSPGWTVISGATEAVGSAVAALTGRGILCRPLPVEHAFHSSHMDPFRHDLVNGLIGIEPRGALIPIHSTVRGRPAEPGDFDAAYWGRNLREPVRFASAITDLLRGGHTHFVEVGPHPVLCAMVSACASGELGVVALPSMRRAQPGRATLLASVARLHVDGFPVDWSGLHPDGGRVIPLPRYPWQHRRYWFTPRRSEATAAGEPIRTPSSGPVALPGRRLNSPVPTYEMLVERDLLPFMNDHRLWGRPVLPAATTVEMVLRGVAAATGFRPEAISELFFHAPLVAGESPDSRVVQLLLHDAPGDVTRFTIHASPGHAPPAEGGGKWGLLARGNVEPAGAAISWNPPPLDPEGVRQRCPEEVDRDAWRAELEAKGVVPGERLPGIDRLWRGPDEALFRFAPAFGDPPDAENEGTVSSIHGALQCCLGLSGSDGADSLRIVAAIHGIRLRPLESGGGAGVPAWCHVRRRMDAESGEGEARVDVTACNEALEPIVELEGIVLRTTDRSALHISARDGSPRRAPDNWFFDHRWEERALPRSPGPRRGEGRMPAPQAVASRAVGEQMAAPDASDAEALAGLEGLARSYAQRAVRALGGDGGAAPPEFLPGHGRYFGRLTDLAGGLPYPDPGEDSDEELGRKAEALAVRCPEHAVAIQILRRCGEAIPKVLRGEADPLALLFGSSPTVEELYRDAPYSRFQGARVAAIVAAAAEALLPGRRLRILEVGAGTGGTTTHILDRLPLDGAEYLFTDLSPALLRGSAERFRDRDFMQFRIADIEDAGVPELPGGPFDVVVAANVLHATRSLRSTLANLRARSAPGGLLVLLETTAPRGWVDVVFGMTEGWWRFEDVDLRPDHPLLGAGSWVRLLEECGFVDPLAVSADADEEGVLPQTILVAAAPGGPEAPETGAHPSEAGVWALWTRGTALAEAVEWSLAGKGERCVRVGREDAWPLEGVSLRGAIDLRAAEEEGGGFTGAELSGVISEACLAPVSAVRTLADRGHTSTPFWLVTRGGEPTAAMDGASVSLLQAPLWGMGRSLAFQYPGAWGGLVDLDPDATTAQAALDLVHEVTASDGEDEVVYRGGRRRVARLVPVPPPGDAGVRLRGDATYLITGGLGGLGRRLALWMVERGARALVLTGRRTLSAPGTEGSGFVETLKEGGVDVRYAAIDASDPRAVMALLADLGKGSRPLRGIVHAAADIAPLELPALDPDAMRAMVDGKAVGAWLLHEHTRDLELDFFVLFSSITAALGSRDLGHYAAANQFLDALARYRVDSGLPALVVDWGTWDVNEALSEDRRDAARRSGLLNMDATAALDALGRLLSHRAGRCTVARIDAPTLRAVFASRRRSRLLDDLGEGASGVAGSAAPRLSTVRERIGRAHAAERRGLLVDLVAELTRSVLGMGSEEPLDPDRGFFELGMDSLMTVQLRERIETAFGEPLSAMLTLNYPTVGKLAGHLLGSFAEGDSSDSSDSSDSGDPGGSSAPSMAGGARGEEEGEADAMVREIGRLSARETRRLLLQELESLGGWEEHGDE
ncbi:MAG: acyltransferase domain-containing protein [Gemmatimonadales bacterium]|nr:MAG: acyltransferase domain-containing protein [Gemmatimonadales bacterium]